MKKDIKKLLKRIKVDNWEFQNGMEGKFSDAGGVCYDGPTGGITIVINGNFKQ